MGCGSQSYYTADDGVVNNSVLGDSYGIMPHMKTIEVIGRVDDQHRLSADVPSTVAPGLIRIALVLPALNDQHLDDTDQEWTTGIANEWNDELADIRQDIYTLTDGEPVDVTR